MLAAVDNKTTSIALNAGATGFHVLSRLALEGHVSALVSADGGTVSGLGLKARAVRLNNVGAVVNACLDQSIGGARNVGVRGDTLAIVGKVSLYDTAGIGAVNVVVHIGASFIESVASASVLNGSTRLTVRVTDHVEHRAVVGINNTILHDTLTELGIRVVAWVLRIAVRDTNLSLALDVVGNMGGALPEGLARAAGIEGTVGVTVGVADKVVHGAVVGINNTVLKNTGTEFSVGEVGGVHVGGAVGDTNLNIALDTVGHSVGALPEGLASAASIEGTVGVTVGVADNLVHRAVVGINNTVLKDTGTEFSVGEVGGVHVGGAVRDTNLNIALNTVGHGVGVLPVGLALAASIENAVSVTGGVTLLDVVGCAVGIAVVLDANAELRVGESVENVGLAQGVADEGVGEGATRDRVSGDALTVVRSGVRAAVGASPAVLAVHLVIVALTVVHAGLRGAHVASGSGVYNTTNPLRESLETAFTAIKEGFLNTRVAGRSTIRISDNAVALETESSASVGLTNSVGAVVRGRAVSVEGSLEVVGKSGSHGTGGKRVTTAVGGAVGVHEHTIVSGRTALTVVNGDVNVERGRATSLREGHKGKSED